MGANIKNKQISGKKIEIYGKMKIARLITFKSVVGVVMLGRWSFYVIQHLVGTGF